MLLLYNCDSHAICKGQHPTAFLPTLQLLTFLLHFLEYSRTLHSGRIHIEAPFRSDHLASYSKFFYLIFQLGISPCLLSSEEEKQKPKASLTNAKDSLGLQA